MCTTMILTRKATADGSMMVTHSDDDEMADQRVVRVPAMDHPEGAMRPVFPQVAIYPRLVTDTRGPAYDTGGEPTPPLGFIPQVAHTYAYFDGNYGIVNEHNLMMGECTDGAKYVVPNPVTEEAAKAGGGPMRIFYSSELSRVALERCTTAREAIELMGHLIETYGFYSTGETLLVGDPDEAWVFEMCSLPDPEYHSAWVAQRVPDGEVFVAANQFRIRAVDPGDPDQMYSKFLFPGAERVGWWTPDAGPLDWLETVSTGEYRHPYYSLRRVWRVMDRVNPDLGLSPWVEGGYTKAYPFSIPPKAPLTREEVFSLYRDHYEGTEFDMTRGVAAGPFGDPHRFYGAYDSNSTDLSTGPRPMGAWERPISVFYQGYTFVNQVRPSAPDATRGVMWLGPDVSYTTCFSPFPTASDSLPWSYQTGSPAKLDREAAWWAFDFVGNWSRLNFRRMTEVDIRPLQSRLEARGAERLAAWDETAKSGGDDAHASVAESARANADEVVAAWWDLADRLVAKYSNGYINVPGEAPKDIGYPTSWVARTDWADGPTRYAPRIGSPRSGE